MYSKKMEVATHCMISSVKTSPLGPLGYILNLPFQSLSPYFCTQSISASFFHIITGVTASWSSLAPQEPVKLCVCANCVLCMCVSFILVSEGRVKVIYPVTLRSPLRMHNCLCAHTYLPHTLSCPPNSGFQNCTHPYYLPQKHRQFSKMVKSVCAGLRQI